MILTDMLIGNSAGLFSVIMLTACLYFSLSYFEYLKEGDKRLTKQAKLFATITLFLGLGVPAVYELFK